MTDRSLATYISVDVWSDIACPWCYIGKRRMEKALEEFTHSPGAPKVKITYHSYEISPDTPADFEGSPTDALLAAGMPADQVEEMFTRVSTAAEAEGVEVHFPNVQHTNTARAHELLHFAKARGKQAELKERLFRAYFTEGRHVGDLDTLAELAVEAGMDRTEALAALTTRRHSADVQVDIAQAHGFGIQSVPFYRIDGKYGISGAMEAGELVAALTQAATDRDAPAAAVSSDDAPEVT